MYIVRLCVSIDRHMSGDRHKQSNVGHKGSDVVSRNTALTKKKTTAWALSCFDISPQLFAKVNLPTVDSVDLGS